MRRISLLTKLRSQSRGTLRPGRAPDPPSGRHDVIDPAAIIAKTRESAIVYGQELIHALSADLRHGQLSQLSEIWEMLPYHVGVVATANFAIQPTTPPLSPLSDPAVAQYIISSRFLAECHTYLLADPNGFERLHLVTGIKLSDTRYTLDQMQKVAMSAQSAVGAKAEQQAFTRACIELSQWGHALLAIFHSHPGTGPHATRPSPDKDLPTHQRLETGDYPLIGAIFVPGYVRFFSTNRPFTVTIYGTGVTPVPGEKNVFQIKSPSSPRHVSYETIAGS